MHRALILCYVPICLLVFKIPDLLHLALVNGAYFQAQRLLGMTDRE